MGRNMETRITIRMSKPLLNELATRAQENNDDVVSWARKLIVWGLHSDDAKVALEQVKEKFSSLEARHEIAEGAITESLSGMEAVLSGLTDRQEKLVEVVKRLADNLETLINPKREKAI